MEGFMSIPPVFPLSSSIQNEDEPMECAEESHHGEMSRKNSADSAQCDGSHNTSTLSLDSSSNVEQSMSPEENLKIASSLKEDATKHFKENSIQQALGLYKKALTSVTQISDDDLSTEMEQQVKELKIALNLNAALCHIKLSDWSEAITAATSVIKLDKNNVKALYRRGLARTHTGDLTEARQDFLDTLKLDSTNNDAKREIQKLKPRLQQIRAKEKEAFDGLFSKTSGLYSDRQRLVDIKKQQEKLDKERELKEYDDANRALEAKGESPFATIEKWRSHKEETNKKASEESFKPAAASSTSAAMKRPVVGSGTTTLDDLDEEEKKILSETKKMGYCYFNRPNQDTTSQSKPAPATFAPLTTTSVDDTKRSISSWNQSGTTYEELDCSTWVQNKVKECLGECQVETSSYDVSVTGVTSLTGDAQIVVLRSSKRYLYDISCRLEWCLKLRDGPSITGVIALSDITSTTIKSDSNKCLSKMSSGVCFPEWLHEASISFDMKYDKKKYDSIVSEALTLLKEQIYAMIQQMETAYNAYA